MTHKVMRVTNSCSQSCNVYIFKEPSVLHFSGMPEYSQNAFLHCGEVLGINGGSES